MRREFRPSPACIRSSRFYLVHVADATTVPEVEKAELAMAYGDSRDRSMGWDSWPAGPEYAANRAEVAA